jgi:hypothetical protein
VQFTTLPVKVEGKVGLAETLGKIEFGKIGLEKMQISLDWAGPPLSLPINVPAGGIPIALELKGWPTANSPLEVHFAGASSSPTPGTSPGNPDGGKDSIWFVVKLILVSGFFGGIVNVTYGNFRRDISGTTAELSDTPQNRPPPHTTLRVSFILKQLFVSIVAAFMVPGVLVFFPVNLLKTASKENLYEALALVSLCLIAATIGKPFIDFVHEEANWLMEKRRRTRSREETHTRPRQDRGGPAHRRR